MTEGPKGHFPPPKADESDALTDVLIGESLEGLFIPLKTIVKMLRSPRVMHNVLNPTILDSAVQLIEGRWACTAEYVQMIQRLCIRCKILEAENAELRTSLEHLENLRSKDVARDSGA